MGGFSIVMLNYQRVGDFQYLWYIYIDISMISMLIWGRLYRYKNDDKLGVEDCLSALNPQRSPKLGGNRPQLRVSYWKRWRGFRFESAAGNCYVLSRIPNTSISRGYSPLRPYSASFSAFSWSNSPFVASCSWGRCGAEFLKPPCDMFKFIDSWPEVGGTVPGCLAGVSASHCLVGWWWWLWWWWWLLLLLWWWWWWLLLLLLWWWLWWWWWWALGVTKDHDMGKWKDQSVLPSQVTRPFAIPELCTFGDGGSKVVESQKTRH